MNARKVKIEKVIYIYIYELWMLRGENEFGIKRYYSLGCSHIKDYISIYARKNLTKNEKCINISKWSYVGMIYANSNAILRSWHLLRW